MSEGVKELALLNSTIDLLIEINEDTLAGTPLDNGKEHAGHIMLKEQINSFKTVKRIINKRIDRIQGREDIKLHPSLREIFTKEGNLKKVSEALKNDSN